MLLKKLLSNFYFILSKIPFYIAIFFIKFYRYLISPFFPASCRYTPTCSQYALQSYRTHNFFFATYLVIKRILKCNPWGGYGYDPVPKKDKNKSIK